jgi:DNA helicase HerA-like ATPase
MFITKLYQAGMARASIKEKDRKDFYLYADEFQNLVTTTFENIFAESRKYGLCLVVAHQYIGQLLPQVLATVMGNVGSIVIFHIGGPDAQCLVAEMTPIFRVEDMINLGTREFFIKMSIDGETFDPFSAETLNILPPTHPSYQEEIIKQSREKYSLPIEIIKKNLETKKELNPSISIETTTDKSIEIDKLKQTQSVDGKNKKESKEETDPIGLEQKSN